MTTREIARKMATRKRGVTSTELQEKAGVSRETASAALTELANDLRITPSGNRVSKVTGRAQVVYVG